jgi:hypothetical protein
VLHLQGRIQEVRIQKGISTSRIANTALKTSALLTLQQGNVGGVDVVDLLQVVAVLVRGQHQMLHKVLYPNAACVRKLCCFQERALGE